MMMAVVVADAGRFNARCVLRSVSISLMTARGYGSFSPGISGRLQESGCDAAGMV
jgi:hypothetical protein